MNCADLSPQAAYHIRCFELHWLGRDPFPNEPWSTRLDGAEANELLYAWRLIVDDRKTMSPEERRLSEIENEAELACAHVGAMV